MVGIWTLNPSILVRIQVRQLLDFRLYLYYHIYRNLNWQLCLIGEGVLTMRTLTVHPNDMANGSWWQVITIAAMGVILTAINGYGAFWLYTNAPKSDAGHVFMIAFGAVAIPGICMTFQGVVETIKKVQQERYLKRLDEELCSHVIFQ
jgi:hypothetical protein